MGTYEDLFGATCERGKVIFQQGDTGETMYIIQSGAIEISQTRHDQKFVLCILEAGDIFGEMALFGDEIRTATATVLQNTRLLSISRESLLQRVQTDPEIIIYLMRIICHRIDKTNLLLKDLIKGDDAVRTNMLKNHSDYKKLYPVTEDEKQVSASSSSNAGNSLIWSLKSSDQCRIIEENETIFSRGDDGNNMFIIIDGLVEINQSVNNEQFIIACLGADDYFGELALLSDMKRTANAVAVRRTTLLPVSKKSLIDKLGQDPEFALKILLLLMQRLRRVMATMENPARLGTYEKQSMPTFIKKNNALKVGIHSLSTCSGCTTILIDDASTLSQILKVAEISYCPLLMDAEEITEVDIAVVDGMVRTNEDIEVLREIRNKSRHLLSWGTCACFGGIPALANAFELEDLVNETFGQTQDVYGYYLSGNGDISGDSYTEDELSLLRRAWKLDDIVKVDYYLPGCPPTGNLLTDLLLEMQGNEPLTRKQAVVCASCDRKPKKSKIDTLWVYPNPNQEHGQDEDEDSKLCFTSKGVMCMGFLTRGGCGSPCTRGGLPCWGCRGPSNAVLKKIGSGGDFDRHVVRSFARRCKLNAADIELVIDIIHSRTNNIINFFHNPKIHPVKIR